MEQIGTSHVTIASLGGDVRMECGQFNWEMYCHDWRYVMDPEEEYVNLELQAVNNMGIELERVSLEEVNKEMNHSNLPG